MTLCLLIALLLSCVPGRIIKLEAVGKGANITTAFLGSYSPLRNNAYDLALFGDVLEGIYLRDCTTNLVTNISTCVKGVLFYPYLIKYKLLEDSLYPKRVGTWALEEYGYATIVPPFSNLNMSVASYMVYYNIVSPNTNETFLSGTAGLYSPGSMDLVISEYNTSSPAAGQVNYTTPATRSDMWLVSLRIHIV